MRHEVRITRQPDATSLEVAVSTHMHRYYAEFLRDIPATSKKREERFKNISKCVIWGFLYVEALTNLACERTILRCCRVHRVARDFWLLSERTEIAGKITFLASVYRVDKTTHKRIQGMVDKLRVVRNRLVHYKDEPTILEPWRLATPMPEGQSFIEAMPDPMIVSAVLSIGVEERRKEILSIGDWIETLLGNPPNDISGV